MFRRQAQILLLSYHSNAFRDLLPAQRLSSPQSLFPPALRAFSTRESPPPTKDNQPHLSHLDERGKARMVDVTEKVSSNRTAEAVAKIVIGETAFKLVEDQNMRKGDVLTVSQLAGIMGAKRTSDLIPLCHPLNLSLVKVDLRLNRSDLSVDIRCEVRCQGSTGVEMEALTGAAVAALTVYDMCKSAGKKDLVIKEVRLVKKTGGKSDFVAG